MITHWRETLQLVVCALGTTLTSAHTDTSVAVLVNTSEILFLFKQMSRWRNNGHQNTAPPHIELRNEWMKDSVLHSKWHRTVNYSETRKWKGTPYYQRILQSGGLIWLTKKGVEADWGKGDGCLHEEDCRLMATLCNLGGLCHVVETAPGQASRRCLHRGKPATWDLQTKGLKSEDQVCQSGRWDLHWIWLPEVVRPPLECLGLHLPTQYSNSDTYMKGKKSVLTTET